MPPEAAPRPQPPPAVISGDAAASLLAWYAAAKVPVVPAFRETRPKR